MACMHYFAPNNTCTRCGEHCQAVIRDLIAELREVRKARDEAINELAAIYKAIDEKMLCEGGQG